jgi:hypothetical protein
MARGWESKAVESQIESAEHRHTSPKEVRLTPTELRRVQQLEGLQLSRTRVLNDIQHATNPRYRDQLQGALRHLESQIDALS